MNVLSPELRWIDGICYRINDSHEKRQIEDTFDPIESGHQNIDDEMDDLEFITCPNGRVKLFLHVPQSFLGNIIGTKGSAKKRIENETGTEIKVPSRGHSGDTIITGPNANAVSTAYRRINMIITAARNKQRPTHFISIPMNSDAIMEQFNKFKEEILTAGLAQGIDPSIFCHPKKLHLTLGMLHLADNEERKIASNLFEEAKINIVKPIFGNESSLDVSMHGVAYMNDDPKSVDVLYAKVMETKPDLRGVLIKLAERFQSLFDSTGYRVGRQNVKLHVTLMNTRMRESDIEGDNAKRISFDGSNILTKYENIEFGDQNVLEIHLSQLGGTEANDVYYQATSIIHIN